LIFKSFSVGEGLPTVRASPFRVGLKKVFYKIMLLYKTSNTTPPLPLPFEGGVHYQAITKSLPQRGGI
jgi:hypothetical protein